MTATLHTARLVLRPVTEDDIPAYEKYFVNYEVIRFLADQVPWPYPDGGVGTFVREKLRADAEDHWFWAIALREDRDALIGAIDLWRKGRPEQRGFWLGQPFWGQGLMTEAATAVTDHAFRDLGFERLVLGNAVGNAGSRRIKEKTGARLLRVEPGGFVDPAFTEKEIWEITRDEWLCFRTTKGVSR